MTLPIPEENAVEPADDVVKPDILSDVADHEKDADKEIFEVKPDAVTFPKTNTHDRRTF